MLQTPIEKTFNRLVGTGTLSRKVTLGFETQKMDMGPKLTRRLRIQQNRIRSSGESPKERHKKSNLLSSSVQRDEPGGEAGRQGGISRTGQRLEKWNRFCIPSDLASE